MEVIKLMRRLMAGIAAASLLTQLHAQNWILTDSSSISFDIKAMGLSAVKGVSNQSQNRLYFDIHTPQNASVIVILPANSLRFNHPALKPMIMGEDFFNSAQYKTVTFKSTEFVPQDSDRFNVQGELTLRGITKPVTFDAVLKPNASNSKLLDVYAVGYINRSDFGMKKSYGGVGEKVDIKLTGQWQLK